jgi:two-component system chemotaxis response regulator CheY
MIVDDSRIMRTVVRKTFDTLKVPCTYLEAGDGEEALRIAQAQKVDLILLDWNMPKLSGIEFLKKVRAMDQYKTTPIVMVTSESARLNVIEAIKEGATAYIIKPISEKVFLDKMSKIIF